MVYDLEKLEKVRQGLEARLEELTGDKEYLDSVAQPPTLASDEIAAIDIGRMIRCGIRSVDRAINNPCPWSPANLDRLHREFDASHRDLARRVSESDYGALLNAVTRHSWYANKGPFWTVIRRDMAAAAKDLNAHINTRTGTTWHGLVLRMEAKFAVGLHLGFLFLWQGSSNPTVYFFIGPSLGFTLGASLSIEWAPYENSPRLHDQFYWFGTGSLTIIVGLYGTWTDRRSALQSGSLGLSVGLGGGIAALGTYYDRIAGP